MTDASSTASSPATQQTKWQALLAAPKGGKEFNPTQSFALQVHWVVRSPQAAAEMISKGFRPCSAACLRDTPTTLAYLFRISQDQRMAAALKAKVTTLGQHPHYEPVFKSLRMGIPRASQEAKLRLGGIDASVLALGEEEPIEAHKEQLDFDPVVLECTEVYLDSRGFYEHAASKEWMKNSAEILKPVRSLKPTTYCLGTPTDDVWEKAVGPPLKAVRFDGLGAAFDDHPAGKALLETIKPGVFFTEWLERPASEKPESTFFLELDFAVPVSGLESARALVAKLQEDTQAVYMVVLPPYLHLHLQTGDFPSRPADLVDLRVMLAVSDLPASAASLGMLATLATTADGGKFVGRLLVYGAAGEEGVGKARSFLEASGVKVGEEGGVGNQDRSVVVVDSQKMEGSNLLAGYALHPLHMELIKDDSFEYQV
ncbi:hypothetical protein HDU96_009697 [Phlyctochytrium bullatum]|nr:hypothetical protein HDU96_009697 [Phlyctochytrium bullatum]